jgi:Fe-S-cluster-containing hydrogenase component 2/pSer/pThr/pTyr-binding forkhead associated (FHA) protein/CRP-like cAMP-binding protein
VVPTHRRETGVTQSDGLAGRWLSLEDLGKLDFFKGGTSAAKFRSRLNTNFELTPGQTEPWLKAAVWREYQQGDVICEAGAYGSTAFLMVEGRASASLPERVVPPPVPGRTNGSLARLQRLFRRRSRTEQAAPDAAAVGEVSTYASLSCDRPPLPVALGPGAVFGVDTCINFYPREATVRAEERCVVVEMLRSVLDTIRLAGAAAGAIDAAYAAAAIRNQLSLSGVFRDLTGEQLERLAQHAELLVNDSDAIRNDVIYAEGAAADAIYLVRAGTIKLSQQKAGGELILSYLGRGTAFGFEALVPGRQSLQLLLHCTSHRGVFPDIEIGGAVTLGRTAGCELRFPKEARAVSRHHCRLQVRDDDVYLTDLDSDNGTTLNGEPIREAIVVAGDVITIVDYTFEVRRVVRDATAAPAPRTRLATATGLDSFEVVRVATADLLRAAEENDRFLESAKVAARQPEAAAYQVPASEQARVGNLVELNLYNSQNVLLIDLDRCTRCDECVKACATTHGGVARFTRDGPRLGHYLVTMACRSCTDPKCMIGCPVGSIRRKDSLEIHIEDWCIGCERCAAQCPFGNINVVELTASVTRPSAPTLQATVCDLCAGFDGPNCVYACPHDAAIRVNPSTFLSAEDTR